MFRKLFKFASIGLLLVSTAAAQQPSQPSVNRLQQIISYLASDALEGRRTGTPGANDAAHYFCVARFRNVTHEKHIMGRERFSKITRDISFQFSGKIDISVYAFPQDAKTNESFAFDGIGHANRCRFADLRMRNEN